MKRGTRLHKGKAPYIPLCWLLTVHPVRTLQILCCLSPSMLKGRKCVRLELPSSKSDVVLGEIVVMKTLALVLPTRGRAFLCVSLFCIFAQLFGTGKKTIEVSVLYPKQWTVTKTPGEGTLKSLGLKSLFRGRCRCFGLKCDGFGLTVSCRQPWSRLCPLHVP